MYYYYYFSKKRQKRTTALKIYNSFTDEILAMNLQNSSAVLSAVTFESPSKGAKNDKSSFLGQRETLNRSSSASRSGPISGGASTLLQKIAESPV